MNSRRIAPLAAALLVIAGLALMAVRLNVRSQRGIAQGDTAWRLTYTVECRAEKAGAKLRAAVPFDTPNSRVFKHEVLSAAGKVERMRERRDEGRELAVTAAEPGTLQATAQFDVHQSVHPVWKAERAARLAPADRQRYLRAERGMLLEHPVVRATLARLAAGNGGQATVGQIFEYCLMEIGPGGKDAPRDAAAAIEKGLASPLGRARAMTAMCRANGLPARLVTGIEVKLGVDVQPHRWVEVYSDGRWTPFDPENGRAGELPPNFIPVRRNGSEIVHGAGIAVIRATFAIVRLPPEPGMGAAGRHTPWEVLDLTRLPIELHDTLAVILLMPLGALATALFRTVIGIRTFGTFTPTLLALAFVYNDWRMGLVVFFAVLILGLTSRTLLDRLKLLVVPRLSAMLTLVVLCMVLGVSAFEYFSPTPSAQAVLLPMVILTMMIERFFLTSEEDSFRFALQLLGGTLIVAVCCYGLLCWKAVGSLLVAYPETHLLTIALLVLLGRYSGYRLTELWRFRDLGSAKG